MTGRRKFGVIVLVTVALLLAGCSSITSGRIIAKQANPAWTQMIISGKSIIPIYHPPSWEFDLYQSKDVHGWHYVSESTYEKYKVGDTYTEQK